MAVNPGSRARDLDHGVGTLQAAPEALALGDARRSVVSEMRRDFQADEAIAAWSSRRYSLRTGRRRAADPRWRGSRTAPCWSRHLGQQLCDRRGVLRVLCHGVRRRWRGWTSPRQGRPLGSAARGFRRRASRARYRPARRSGRACAVQKRIIGMVEASCPVRHACVRRLSVIAPKTTPARSTHSVCRAHSPSCHTQSRTSGMSSPRRVMYSRVLGAACRA